MLYIFFSRVTPNSRILQICNFHGYQFRNVKKLFVLCMHAEKKVEMLQNKGGTWKLFQYDTPEMHIMALFFCNEKFKLNTFSML